MSAVSNLKIYMRIFYATTRCQAPPKLDSLFQILHIFAWTTDGRSVACFCVSAPALKSTLNLRSDPINFSSFGTFSPYVVALKLGLIQSLARLCCCGQILISPFPPEFYLKSEVKIEPDPRLIYHSHPRFLSYRGYNVFYFLLKALLFIVTFRLLMIITLNQGDEYQLRILISNAKPTS